MLAAGVKNEQANSRIAFLEIEKQFGDADQLAFDLFLPAKLDERNIFWNKEVLPFNLNAMASKV